MGATLAHSRHTLASGGGVRSARKLKVGDLQGRNATSCITAAIMTEAEDARKEVRRSGIMHIERLTGRRDTNCHEHTDSTEN
jgi:hypothetical protein